MRIEGRSRCPCLPALPGLGTASPQRALPWPVRPEALVSCECPTLLPVSGSRWTWFLARGTAPRLPLHPSRHSCPLTNLAGGRVLFVMPTSSVAVLTCFQSYSIFK